MRRVSGEHLVDAVREVLLISDALGLCETSIHLNAALTTLDGRGLLPPDKKARKLLH